MINGLSQARPTPYTAPLRERSLRPLNPEPTKQITLTLPSFRSNLNARPSIRYSAGSDFHSTIRYGGIDSHSSIQYGAGGDFHSTIRYGGGDFRNGIRYGGGDFRNGIRYGGK